MFQGGMGAGREQVTFGFRPSLSPVPFTRGRQPRCLGAPCFRLHRSLCPHRQYGAGRGGNHATRHAAEQKLSDPGSTVGADHDGSNWAWLAFAMSTAHLNAAPEAREKSVACRMRRNRLMDGSLCSRALDGARRGAGEQAAERGEGVARQIRSLGPVARRLDGTRSRSRPVDREPAARQIG
jgi:hypothetical protein